jgi:hypothetical protein
MRANTFVRILGVVVVVLFTWKYGLPWWNAHQTSSSAPKTTSPGVNCVFAARAASDFFGGNLRAFSSPPYDMTAWDEFKSHVDDRISIAGTKCSCNDDACENAKHAMSELRALMGEMDNMVRSGSPPPSDIVQRQERIDNALDAARAASEK